jgi:hypothetical protein
MTTGKALTITFIGVLFLVVGIATTVHLSKLGNKSCA